jgi:hypothetical protein
MPDPSERADQATARLVLVLDTAITTFRAGKSTGIPALDSASRLIGDMADDATTSNATRRGQRRRIPRRPDRVELEILTALADTYGSEMLSNAPLGYALRLVARQGGIALVQRVLWGESASDVQLATMLGATRAAFTQISLAFPDVFLAEANDVIAWFRPRPPSESAPRKGGPHE